VLAAKQAIIDGSLQVFSGPIKDQTGTVAIPAGSTATDGQLLGMDWFVQGVQGSTK
jgi:basic membrane protein A